MERRRPTRTRIDAAPHASAARLLGLAAMLFLALLCATAVADAARAVLWSAPSAGGGALTRLLMAAALFAALPLVTLGGPALEGPWRTVTPPWLAVLRVGFIRGACAGAMAILAWELGDLAIARLEEGAVAVPVRMKLLDMAAIAGTLALLTAG